MQKIQLSKAESLLLQEYGFNITNSYGTLVNLPGDNERFPFIIAYVFMSHGIWCAVCDDPFDKDADGDYSHQWPFAFLHGKIDDLRCLVGLTVETTVSSLAIQRCVSNLWKISKAQDRSFIPLQESFV